MVGLLPLCASTVFEPDFLAQYPAAAQRMGRFIEKHSDLCENLADPRVDGVGGRPNMPAPPPRIRASGCRA
jgi:hypothetical protein